MDLITVREIYRDRDKFLGKEIQIGGWGEKHPRF